MTQPQLNDDGKLLIIGIDGATWDILEPWIKQGALPTLEKLCKNGVTGKLECTIPPLTPPGWASAFTGTNPGKHNIFDFFVHDGYEKKLVTSRDRKARAIWQILSDKKHIVINVPQTYPPEEINGIMISGMGTPDLKSNFTYPLELKDQITSMGYMLDYEDLLDYNNDKDIYVNSIKEMIIKRTNVATHLMKNHEWDVFTLVYVATDRIQHFFWKYMDPKNPAYNHPESKKYRNAIFDTYKQLDKSIEHLLNGVDENVTTVVFSDHGFGPIYYDVYLNNYFKDLGLLDIKHDNKNSLLQKIGFTQDNIVNIGSYLGKLGFGNLVRFVYAKTRKQLYINMGMRYVDWSKTTAWFSSISGQSIRLNLKGREPDGIIDQKDYDKTIELIIKKLHELEDPATKEKIVDEVYRRGDVYSGPYAKHAEDLIVKMKSGYVLQENFGEKLVMPSKQGPADRSGDHRINGIFMIKGDSIKVNSNIKNARIIDLAPTILHMFGAPIPRDMDGRVLTEIFRADSEMAQREIVYEEDKTKAEKNKDVLKSKIGNLKQKRKI